MDITQLKKKIVDYTKLVQSRGYTVASEGNISIRLPDNHIIITPTRMIKDFITIEDLVVIDIDGNQVEGSKKLHPNDLPIARSTKNELISDA